MKVEKKVREETVRHKLRLHGAIREKSARGPKKLKKA